VLIVGRVLLGLLGVLFIVAGAMSIRNATEEYVDSPRWMLGGMGAFLVIFGLFLLLVAAGGIQRARR
jgi:uncharacterized membrane protein HdeD (DUF308 family)